jgi:tRNA threonylcarbamoyladenosine biosynthesis protein TsaB
MKILGIDSSTDKLAIGVCEEGQVISETLLESSREHASHIIGLIDSVLTESSVAKADLGGVAVAIGPGSFTGLRIGLAVAKGLAVALEIPLVGVSTFEVIARRLLPEMDSFFLAAPVRRGECYLCHLRPGIEIRASITLIDNSKLAETIGAIPAGTVGRAPNGWDGLVGSKIAPDKLIISGGELALLGAEYLAAGKSDNVAELEPLYIAPSQAERKFGKK